MFDVTVILLPTSPTKQLPTIRSRCQLIRFRQLTVDVVAKLLVSHGLVADPSEAGRLAQYSEGSIERALELADAELWTFRNTLVERLAEASLDSVQLAKTVRAFVDEAGKEPSARRARLRQVVAFATDFYRQLLHVQCDHFQSQDIELQRVVQRAIDAGQTDVDSTAARLDRCLDAAGQIDRNANQATLVECWWDDLA